MAISFGFKSSSTTFTDFFKNIPPRLSLITGCNSSFNFSKVSLQSFIDCLTFLQCRSSSLESDACERVPKLVPIDPKTCASESISTRRTLIVVSTWVLFSHVMYPESLPHEPTRLSDATTIERGSICKTYVRGKYSKKFFYLCGRGGELCILPPTNVNSRGHASRYPGRLNDDVRSSN